MDQAFSQARKHVTLIKREHKRHAEAVAREEQNHLERLAEIDKAELTPAARALVAVVLQQEAAATIPACMESVPDLEPEVPERLRQAPPALPPGSTVAVEDKPKRGRP